MISSDDLSFQAFASQSPAYSYLTYEASNAVDRNTATCMRTDAIGNNAPNKHTWWKVDLGAVYSIYSIDILFKNYDSFGMYVIVFLLSFGRLLWQNKILQGWKVDTNVVRLWILLKFFFPYVYNHDINDNMLDIIHSNRFIGGFDQHLHVISMQILQLGIDIITNKKHRLLLPKIFIICRCLTKCLLIYLCIWRLYYIAYKYMQRYQNKYGIYY